LDENLWRLQHASNFWLYLNDQYRTLSWDDMLIHQKTI
jgi:hypothetical protein